MSVTTLPRFKKDNTALFGSVQVEGVNSRKENLLRDRVDIVKSSADQFLSISFFSTTLSPIRINYDYSFPGHKNQGERHVAAGDRFLPT